MKYITYLILLSISVNSFAQNSVKQLSLQLTQSAPNDSLKVAAIFEWITGSIQYDLETFQQRLPTLDLGNSQSSAVVLNTRKAICGGYSNLFYDLCKYAGIKTQVIEGLGKIRNSSNPSDSTFRIESHAWNAVKLNEKWYLLDLTWSSGAMINNTYQQRRSWEFYMISPAVFLLTHYPSDPVWQLQKRIISYEEFVKGSPFLKTKRFDYERILAQYESLDSTTQVLETQERIIAHDPKNDNAHNMLGYFYATRSTKTLEEYTVISRLIRDNKNPKEQQALALQYKNKMFELLHKAEMELNKSLDYYNHIGPLAQIKGVLDNKNAIYNNLEAIRKDKEMMNRYFAILGRNKR
ncbi:transglutaminase domain-containing protein [Flectobacillus rivi]|uniref:Transglutaminase domain-containing protein n=1 Tax=Flectobacillus rivi TaxID=2984209 RepID=A0ABT6Z692_9BACT|nr:transglutaminase domain-containing protein [Flectobacillus rivi]MDI9876638.1 transglutaminase domain-containing protein [Flectobacillus rivi]